MGARYLSIVCIASISMGVAAGTECARAQGIRQRSGVAADRGVRDQAGRQTRPRPHREPPGSAVASGLHLSDHAAGRRWHGSRQGAGEHQRHRRRSNQANGIAQHQRCPGEIRTGHHHQRSCRQSIPAGRAISRLRRFAGVRHAAGTRGVPERRAHQRSVRRHRQLGSDSDRRHQIGHRGDQQSRLRPERAGRGRRCADEGWLQLSRRRDRYHGRLVRAHPEFGAVGQADRQFRRLRRARRIARRRISKFLSIERPALLWRRRRQERSVRISCQHGRRRQRFRRDRDRAGRTAAAILGRHLHLAADLDQQGRLRQSDRKGRGHADLDRRRHRACAHFQPEHPGRQSDRHPALHRRCDAALLWRRQHASQRSERRPARQSVRRRTPCSARSIERRRERRRRAPRCRRPTPTSCSGTTITSWSEPVSTTASPTSRPARNWGRSARTSSSAAPASSSVNPAVRFRSARSRCAPPTSTPGSTRSTPST